MRVNVLRNRLTAVLIVLVTAAVSAVPAFAAPAAVNEASVGVFTIVYCYPVRGTPSRVYAASYGSGFLVSDSVIITCDHVIHLEDTPEGRAMADSLRRVDSDYLNKMEIRVYYKPDAYYQAKEIAKMRNSKHDYTAIMLQSPIRGYRALALAEDLKYVLAADAPVYALGAPYDTTITPYAAGGNAVTFRSCGVREGVLNDVSLSGELQHTAMPAPGMAGGPLVNEDGAVVGLNQTRSGSSASGSCAFPSSEIVYALQTFGMYYSSFVPKPSNTDPSVPKGPRGDADLDGKVLAKDARLALRVSAKLETLEPQGFANCDLNGDGRLFAGEARKILRYSAKLEKEI